jgi:ribosomal protein L15
VTPETLLSAGLISKRSGALPRVKILGAGALAKELTISGCAVSASAKAAIEKAGGKIHGTGTD